jgi:hypothetical protein
MNEKLFKVDTKSPELANDKRELFHTIVAKGLFAWKCAKPDLQAAIECLTTRVKALNDQDWF